MIKNFYHKLIIHKLTYDKIYTSTLLLTFKVYRNLKNYGTQKSILKTQHPNLFDVHFSNIKNR